MCQTKTQIKRVTLTKTQNIHMSNLIFLPVTSEFVSQETNLASVCFQFTSVTRLFPLMQGSVFSPHNPQRSHMSPETYHNLSHNMVSCDCQSRANKHAEVPYLHLYLFMRNNMKYKAVIELSSSYAFFFSFFKHGMKTSKHVCLIKCCVPFLMIRTFIKIQNDFQE